ncbi:aminodeoxychorismate synthase component I [Thiomicrorhabdus sp. Milos-T2]|uniref:aminodeoxychorismate synthase component I n=1 Tax=Thiomicrorhabdus sp. Milos-T2 TaxID=90814 RepID=UPI0004945D81|nr:aminodeoxychorismate synthase component I [Thiomicrorhabdus sp. Milos-T2]
MQSQIIKVFKLPELPGLVEQDIDLTQLHELNPDRYPFLLESVAKGGLGEFDILFAYPQQSMQLDNLADAQRFIKQVQTEFKSHINRTIDNPAKLPFIGGWFAYFSYDYAQVVEPVLNLPQSKFPLAHLTRVPAAIILEHATGKMTLMAEPEFADVIPQIEADLTNVILANSSQTPSNLKANQQANSQQKVQVIDTQEEPEAKYLAGVETIKEYILAGDVFQVNLSRQWQVELAPNSDYLSVYRALKKSNPAPFASLVHFKDGGAGNHHQAWQIVSSSPERLVKYQAPWVETRPIAGTRKRGNNEAADKALVTELIEHPKERAEHIMLIDLERNDLGRICQPGSVEVNELMVVETYEHVHHIVSNVRGKLQPDLSPLDIVHALFPGGTITGCPKIRCMEIVAELEQMPREAYTGSLGYINLDGSLDLNILIRTMIQFEEQGKPIVQFRAGAGIVTDSKAKNELTETRHKAKGLIKAFDFSQSDTEF